MNSPALNPEVFSPIRYDWDEDFDIKDFKKAIDNFNNAEANAADENSRYLDRVSIDEAARITYTDSVEELLSSLKHDIVIPLIISPTFMDFTNDIIKTALVEHGFAGIEALQPYAGDRKKDMKEITVKWRLDKILNWQMLDRRIDE